MRRCGALEGGDPVPGSTGQAVELTVIEPPGAIENFSVSAEPGENALLVTWDEVEGATSYKLRWRQSGGEFDAANATTVTDTNATVTVSGYGEWEVRAQGCGEGGCGPEASGAVELTEPPTGLRVAPVLDDKGRSIPGKITATWEPLSDATRLRAALASAPTLTPGPMDREFSMPDRHALRQAMTTGPRMSRENSGSSCQLAKTSVEFTLDDEGAYSLDLLSISEGGGIGDAQRQQPSRSDGKYAGRDENPSGGRCDDHLHGWQVRLCEQSWRHH